MIGVRTGADKRQRASGADDPSDTSPRKRARESQRHVVDEDIAAYPAFDAGTCELPAGAPRTLPDLLLLCDAFRRYKRALPVALCRRICARPENARFQALSRVAPVLREIDQLVGLAGLKVQIARQVLAYAVRGDEDATMKHVALLGPPGVGKSRVAGLLARLYVGLRIVRDAALHTACRSDLVGQYLGETAKKTTDYLTQAGNAVVFIDEAYSLGADCKSDIYATECIDSLTKHLSENSGTCVCIVAGYKEDMRARFFGLNRGLDRRFPWKFDLDAYSPADLGKIFEQQVRSRGATLADPPAARALVEAAADMFPNYGGSTETFVSRCLLEHACGTFMAGSPGAPLETSTVAAVIAGLEHGDL